MPENNFMISVIVPIFNYKNSLRDIFTSINRQTIGFDNVELIFVADSSVYELNKALQSYSDLYSNIKVIFLNRECKYPGELKNIGIRNSSADYIIFFENVEELYDEAFEILYNKIECNYDIIFGKWSLSVMNDENKDWIDIDLDGGELVVRDIIENNDILTLPPAISSKIFRKSIIAENNLEFPKEVPCENLVFLSEYLLNSRNILFIDDDILRYFDEEGLWGTSIEIDSKDYLLELMETYIEVYYLFRMDDRLARVIIHYLKNWFELFTEFKLTIFERFEILKFSEFILVQSKNRGLNLDFNIICLLVFEKDFYEASIFSSLLNDKIVFKKAQDSKNYVKTVEEIELFRKSRTDNFKIEYHLDDELYEFINDLAIYNVELRLVNKFINRFGDKDILKAIKLINKWNLFDYEFYVSDQDYGFDLDPLLHYIFWGYKEGRNPNEKFDGIFYRNYYDNVRKAHLNPLVYFVLQGVDKCEIKINRYVFPESRSSIDKTVLRGKIRNFHGCGVTKVKRDMKLIVSLTSFPERMYDLHFTLYSLLNQDLKPDEVILWLAKDQFPNGEADIPKDVLNLKKNGLSIEWCDNIFSYKKLIPALKRYPNQIIVTADDDIFYPVDWLRKLYEEHKKYPDTVIAHRVRRIALENNSILEYADWEVSFHEEPPSYLNFFTGAGGVLYPPNSLDDEVFNCNLAKKLTPTADDIWFWAMAVLNNTKIKSVKDSFTKLTYVNLARDLNMLNQKVLFSVNMAANNEQIGNVLNEFPQIMENIINDN